MRRRPPNTSSPVEGARDAVYEAYVRLGASLSRFIRRFMPNPPDIEDIAQEAFLRAYTAERGRPIEQPKSFLFRIARHLALNELSCKRRQITDYIEDFDDLTVIPTGDSAEDEFSAHQILGVHCEAVAALSPQCRQAYLLRTVYGLPHKEIAAQLCIAVGTVEKHLIEAVGHCDRYVRERIGARSARGMSPPAQAEDGT